MRRTGLIWTAALLAGCAHVASSPVLPSSTPAAYAEAPEGGGEPDLKAWWRRFGDPTLTELVGRALEANLDLKTTAARIEEARQQEIIAGARAQPQVQADVSASRNRISEHAIPIPPGGVSRGPGGPAAGGTPFALPGSATQRNG